MKFVESEKDDFVQIADVLAYCLQAHFRGGIKTNELRELVAEIAKSQHIISPAIWKNEGEM